MLIAKKSYEISKLEVILDNMDITSDNVYNNILKNIN
jgi:hypothetical protein